MSKSYLPWNAVAELATVLPCPEAELPIDSPMSSNSSKHLWEAISPLCSGMRWVLTNYFFSRFVVRFRLKDLELFQSLSYIES